MDIVQRRRETTIRALSLVAAVALVGSGLISSVIAVSAANAATSHKAKSLTISTSKNPQLGTILVSRTTLYTLTPSATPCTTQCVKIWPEVLLPKGVTKAKAGAGVKAAKLGTVKRAHGALQVTYAGKPLYWFSGDTAAGQANGNVTDLWGKWSVFVTAKLVNASPSPAVSPTSPAAGTSPPPTSAPTHPTSPPAGTSPPTTASPPPTTPPASPPTTTIPSSGGGSGGVGF
jgi:predicted lipoprotein with Yx(FWY)xxD motif